MPTVKTYNAAEQYRLLAIGAPRGYTTMQDIINHQRYDIHELMLQRGNTLGFDEYGDASFHKSTSELRREAMEEAADMLLYCTILGLRHGGRLFT